MLTDGNGGGANEKDVDDDEDLMANVQKVTEDSKRSTVDSTNLNSEKKKETFVVHTDESSSDDDGILSDVLKKRPDFL